jgi:ankyrin repeat protein
MHKKALLIFSPLLMIHSIRTEQPSPQQQSFLNAVRNRDTKAIQEELNRDGDCSATEEGTGNNALHILAEQDDEQAEKIIDLLTTQPDRSGILNWFYYCWYNYPKLPNKDEKNKDGDAPLQKGINTGNIRIVRKLLEKKANTLDINKEKLPAAFVMSHKGDPRFIPLIAQYLRQQKYQGNTPLDYSLLHNKIEFSKGLIQQTNMAQDHNDRGENAAIFTATLPGIDRLRFLHEQGVDFNAPGAGGKRPLHISSQAGDYDKVAFLLTHGASVDVTDDSGNNSLQLSILYGKDSIAELLIAHKTDITHRNQAGKDAFYLSLELKRIALSQKIAPLIDINARNTQGKTYAILAIEEGKHEILNNLLACKINIRITDSNGENALDKSAQRGDLTSLAMICTNTPAIIHDVNQKNGYTALTHSIRYGQYDAMVYLIDRGAKATIIDKDGRTLLHHAEKLQNPAIVAYLVQKQKLSVDAQDNNGYTPFHCAAAQNNVAMMKELRQRNASIALTTKKGDSPAHTAAQKGSLDALSDMQTHTPTLFGKCNNAGNTPFVEAAKAGELAAVQFLKPDKKFVDETRAALFQAHQYNHFRVYRYLERELAEWNAKSEEILNHYQIGKRIIEEKDQIIKVLTRQDLTNFALTSWRHYVTEPHSYSLEELSSMTRIERAAVENDYLRFENTATTYYNDLKQKLNVVKNEQEQERIQHVLRQQAKEDQARQDRQNDLLLQQEMQARARAKQDKEEEDALKRKQQADELKKWNDKKAADDKFTADQKKQLDYYAEQKAITDKTKADAAKHQKALEEQHPHVSMDLQPSAPPMENSDELFSLVFDKLCIIGDEDCANEDETGKTGVAQIPCTNCKKSSDPDHICPKCLGSLIKRNGEIAKKNNNPDLQNKCLICGKNTFEPSLVQKILAAQKK